MFLTSADGRLTLDAARGELGPSSICAGVGGDGEGLVSGLGEEAAELLLAEKEVAELGEGRLRLDLALDGG